MQWLGRALKRLAARIFGKSRTHLGSQSEQPRKTPVYPGVDKNLAAIRTALEPSTDLVLRKVGDGRLAFGLAMIDGLVSRDEVDRDIIGALLTGYASARGSTTLSVGAAARRLAEAAADRPGGNHRRSARHR